MSSCSTVYIQSMCIYMHIKVECEIMCYINIPTTNFVTCNKVWRMNFLENDNVKKLQLQKFLRKGHNISEINPLFALVYDSDALARRWYTPFKHNHKTLVQGTVYPETRYVVHVRFSQYVLRYFLFNITHHFTFYFYRHAYTRIDWIRTFLQGEIPLYHLLWRLFLYTTLQI